MTATNDQIVDEAYRRAAERGWRAPPIGHCIIEVVREGWTPPVDPEVPMVRVVRGGWTPPVDPDVLAVRRLLAEREGLATALGQIYASGVGDLHPYFKSTLAAYKAGKEAKQ